MLTRDKFDYVPYFCEENARRLLDDQRIISHGKAYLVFITNRDQTCAMQCQRVGAGGMVVWDYHVVVLTRGTSALIWDFDTTLAWPCTAQTWLSESFPDGVAPQFKPSFRVVVRVTAIAQFASDRRHMPPQPVPPWAPYQTAYNTHSLPQFLDLTDNTLGRVMDHKTFLAFVLAAPDEH